MYLKNLNFTQWCKNHLSDHKDKWYRELYPFHIFQKTKFHTKYTGVEQKIILNGISYFINIKNIRLQDNGKYISTFSVTTYPHSKAQEWKKRKWNTLFQIVYSNNYDFITVFTKNDDPSKDLINRFMKGNFLKIYENKSIPISELLIRTLILHIAEEAFCGGIHHQTFSHIPEGFRNLNLHPQFLKNKFEFSPLYSVDRELWVCYAFNEEKAHRVAFHVANQCKNLLVVFCNPTYTKHHRCTFSQTKVISLYEFSNMVSSDVRKKYEPQIRFLQNHLNYEEKIIVDNLIDEINNPTKDTYEIKKSELMEALGVMKIIPINDIDFFQSLAAVNLINAFISRCKSNEKENKLFKNMYFFKTYLSNILSERINNPEVSKPIFITEHLIIVELFDFQFSFHHVPLNEVLLEFSRSDRNIEIIWTGKRLQPIAPLILQYARSLKQGEIKAL